MATATIVVTYTAGSAGTSDDAVTSATVGGVAWASLTAADIRLLKNLMGGLDKLIASEAGGLPGGTLSAAAKAQVNAGIRTVSTT